MKSFTPEIVYIYPDAMEYPLTKKIIAYCELLRFPSTKLDMDKNNRKMKWGKYGRYKYAYTTMDAKDIKTYISELINHYFPDSTIEYFT